MKHFSIYLIFVCLLAVDTIFAQTKKSVEAIRIDKPLTIDGVLNENFYSTGIPAKDFVQIQPYNGHEAYEPTEVYFFYDENAIYVGAMLHDKKDSIFNFLTQRDNIGASDYFGVYLDPFNQGQLAYGFFLTPAGVQIDIKASNTSDGDREDGSWNAVWESKTRITENGWSVEMRIPWAALRFPVEKNEVWGINIFRNLRRHNSNNSWSLIDRKIITFLNQAGELRGISNIKPPVRLSLSPYLATYFEPSGNGESAKFVYKGGLDLKYGINESFTLDMMVIPDFGQIQSDDQKLNLTPFELYYDERRQFFTEGTELFNRGGIFYSRRIGSAPKFTSGITVADNESLSFQPAETQLLNATKVTGRTNNNLGIGILNAMSLPAYTIIDNTQTGNSRKATVQPFTNYNVAVVDKSLPNNSYISLINTNVSMYNHNFKANVTATEFQLIEKSKTYALCGNGAFSTRNENTTENGFHAKLGLEKRKGKIFGGVNERIYSDNYNPNDLGYLQHNNQVTTEAWLYSQIIEPFWIFREINGNIWWNYNRMYRPSTFFDNETGFELNSTFKNNYKFSLSGTYNSDKFDYYEPRVTGRFYLSPFFYFLKTSIFSDTRKPLSAKVTYSHAYQPANNNFMNEFSLESEWRLGQKVTIGYETEYSTSMNERGFSGLSNALDTIFFSQRDVYTITNTFESAYILNNKAGIKMRARHYWSGVKNNHVFNLNNHGQLTQLPMNNDISDQNFNYFTIDMVFRWIFAPGSEMSVAWKTLSHTNDNKVNYKYFSNLSNAWQNQQHSISLKVLYYIDYNSIFKKKN